MLSGFHFDVDPPGLEPGLFGTKIRRVANYTTGQSAANLKKKPTHPKLPGFSYI